MSRHGVWSLLAFAVLACQDGQSGSENNDPKPPFPMPGPMPPGIPGTPHCPCGTTGGVPPIKARVVGSEAFPEVGQTRYRLVAEELFGEIPGVAVGDEFGGYSDGNLPCGGAAPIAIGDEVLALYTRGHQDDASCCEYIACSTDCQSLVTPDGDDAGRNQCEAACRDETATACAAHADEARLRGTLVLSLWGEQIAVGHSGSVTATIDVSDVPALALPMEECTEVLEDLYPLLWESDPSEPAPAPGPSPTPTPAEPGASPEPPVPAPPATTPPPSATTPAGTPAPPVNPSSPSGGPSVAHPEEVRVRCAAP
jgi:hypothetical protein